MILLDFTPWVLLLPWLYLEYYEFTPSLYPLNTMIFFDFTPWELWFYSDLIPWELWFYPFSTIASPLEYNDLTPWPCWLYPSCIITYHVGIYTLPLTIQYFTPWWPYTVVSTWVWCPDSLSMTKPLKYDGTLTTSLEYNDLHHEYDTFTPCKRGF